MSVELVTVEYLLENSSLTQDDFGKLDIAQFIQDYEITESVIAEFNMKLLLEEYIRETDETAEPSSEYAYLLSVEKEQNGITNEELQEIKVIALYITSGTDQVSIILDFDKKTGFYATAQDLVQDQPSNGMKQIEMQETDKEAIIRSLEYNHIKEWGLEYHGSNEETTGSFAWCLYIGLEDGRVIRYSGEGVEGESTPPGWNNMILEFKTMFEG